MNKNLTFMILLSEKILKGRWSNTGHRKFDSNPLRFLNEKDRKKYSFDAVIKLIQLGVEDDTRACLSSFQI